MLPNHTQVEEPKLEQNAIPENVFIVKKVVEEEYFVGKKKTQKGKKTFATNSEKSKILKLDLRLKQICTVRIIRKL